MILSSCQDLFLDSDNETDPYEKQFEHLRIIFDAYKDTHGWLTSFLCVLGILLNACNVLVLTRPKMISTVNLLLTAVATCDSGLMLSYLIYLAHFRIAKPADNCDLYTSYSWAVFTLFHAHFSVVMRAASLWLTVVMAIVRREILKSNVPNPSFGCHTWLACRLIALTLITVTLINLPVYLTYDIRVISVADVYNECNKPEYIVDLAPEALLHDCFLTKLVFWTHGMVNKLLPCVLLTLLLLYLVVFVRQHCQNRQNNGFQVPHAMRPTTPILLCIIGVTLVTELPHVVLAVLSAVTPGGRAYVEHIYENLGDILDLLSLLNCITTFVLYCSMSKVFRDSFLDIANWPVTAWREWRSASGLRRPLLAGQTSRERDTSMTFANVDSVGKFTCFTNGEGISNAVFSAK